MFDQLGPAVNSGKSLFLYGAPGNGKTVVAEGIGRALGGDIYVPYAVDVDGQVITMFDPVNHQLTRTAGGCELERRRLRRARPPLGADPASRSSWSAAS
jgi:predicted ATPase with chaperone activity